MSKKSCNPPPKFRNTLYTHDNLYVMNGMNSESVDLIYTDPPFNSKKLYSAPIGSKAAGTQFKDIWTWKDVDNAYLERLLNERRALAEFIAPIQKIHSKPMASYICFMAQRIIEMHRILKSDGSFYLHVDPTASHYLKIVCDEVFGKNNFVTEIIWHYGWGNHTKKRWNKKHDVILFYTKSKKFTFNADEVRIPYSEKSIMSKDLKWNKSYNKKGKLPVDVIYVPTINAMAKERTGHPTQKPLALVEKFIRASSNIGDIVFDPFCGCATAMVAAQQWQRNWIGIDIGKKASEFVAERLSDDSGLFTDYLHTTRIPNRTDIELVKPKYTKNEIKAKLYDTQKQKCKGCGEEMDVRHFEIDHIIPKSKGGQDYIENYQLLCASCNRTKGNRPMEYLIAVMQNRKLTLAEISFK